MLPDQPAGTSRRDLLKLIGLTAGTLVYLFLLALILGHRRPRLLERLLFFLTLSLFLIYAGALLQINSEIHYGAPPVASNWLIGADPSTGWMTSRCSRTPSAATVATPARQASGSGQP